MAKINLLPWREEAKRQQVQRFGAQIGAGVAVTVLAWNSEITKLQSELTEISALESTKTQLLDRMEIIQNLQTQRPQIVHMFQELAMSLPEGLYLQNLRQNGQALHVVGQAESNGGVSEFMRKLDSSEWLDQPAVQVIETGKDDNSLRKFELNLKQSTPSVVEEEFDPMATEEYQQLLGLEG